MKKYESESSFAKNELSTKSYKEKLSNFESELHDLSDKLIDCQTKYLENNGYAMIVIDDVRILVDESMSFQELHSELQQVPPPETQSDNDYALYNLVSPEDIQESRNSKRYKKVVDKRQKLIDNIQSIYEDFWENEVKPVSDSKEQSIVYLISGLNKNINSDTLSEITGIKEKECRGYEIDEDGIVILK